SRGARLKIEATVSIGRYTTLGAGGPAKALAKPTSLEEIEESLTWARRHDLPVAVVGLGSNLLVADEGVDALVLKLGGELTSAEVRGALLIAGGGAANAGWLHRGRGGGRGGCGVGARVKGRRGRAEEGGCVGQRLGGDPRPGAGRRRQRCDLAASRRARPLAPSLGARPGRGRCARAAAAGA